MTTERLLHDSIDWLLEGDPSIRFQTLRDLLHDLPMLLMEEQNKIATSGWGSRLLKMQDASGLWGGGYYSPKWTSTTYTLLLLWRMALSPDNAQAIRGCQRLLDKGCWPDGGINFSKSYSYSETCVTGMILSVAAYFCAEDPRVHDLAAHLIDQQMADGGWNCESFKGATHSSFHTTLMALEGLWEYEVRFPRREADIQAVRQKGHDFLLTHHLFQSHRTGEVFDPRMTRLSFPPRWRYDVMRVLDYFQMCGAPFDSRMNEALDIIRKKEKDARWPLQQKHPGRVHFDLEKPGRPSRWNTLRALRILMRYGDGE